MGIKCQMIKGKIVLTNKYLVKPESFPIPESFIKKVKAEKSYENIRNVFTSDLFNLRDKKGKFLKSHKYLEVSKKASKQKLHNFYDYVKVGSPAKKSGLMKGTDFEPSRNCLLKFLQQAEFVSQKQQAIGRQNKESKIAKKMKSKKVKSKVVKKRKKSKVS